MAHAVFFYSHWIFLNISFLWPLPKISFRISKNPGQSLVATAAADYRATAAVHLSCDASSSGAHRGTTTRALDDPSVAQCANAIAGPTSAAASETIRLRRAAPCARRPLSRF